VAEEFRTNTGGDAGGVALAAIQALKKENEELKAALHKLDSRLDEIEQLR